MPSIKRRERELAAKAAPKAPDYRPADATKLLTLARMFAPNPNGAGLVDHTTSTGRALSVGKVTRKSWGVRKHARGEVQAPLGFGLAVHPMRLSPTPRNPLCETKLHQYGAAVSILAKYRNAVSFERGNGLLRKRERWSIVHGISGKTLGYHHDGQYALGWKLAASDRGVKVNLIDNGNEI